MSQDDRGATEDQAVNAFVRHLATYSVEGHGAPGDLPTSSDPADAHEYVDVDEAFDDPTAGLAR